MNLIRFTFANIFDFKSVMDAIKSGYENEYGPLELSNSLYESNSDKLIIVFRYHLFTRPYIMFVNSICTPTNIEELHE